MYPDYVSGVMEKYKRLRNTGRLSPRLLQPSPAKIKEECIDVYASRFEKKDENTLRVFFRHTGDIKLLPKSMEEFGLGKFRALSKFLIKEEGKTDKRNIELLAWLIDYDQRPFALGKKYDPVDPADPVNPIPPPGPLVFTRPVEPGHNNEEDDPVEIGLHKTGKKESRRRIIVLSLLVLVFGFVGYKWGMGNKNSGVKIPANGTCMYWAGDHYAEGTCIQRGGDSVLAALDPNRLRNFRRVPDSLINSGSIGKVWYRVKEDKYEFYTMGGKHPVDGRYLRGLTEKSYGNYLESLKR